MSDLERGSTSLFNMDYSEALGEADEHMYTYTCAYMCIFTYNMHRHIRTHIHTHTTDIHTYIYIYTHTNAHTHTHTHANICMGAYLHQLLYGRRVSLCSAISCGVSCCREGTAFALCACC